jgi:redox-sensitive bicupin YhaK (pirin superfamily)
MNRKEFIKKSVLASAVTSLVPQLVHASNESHKASTYDTLMEKVGFNHLPNIEHKTMNTVIHRAATRGHANHGWLDSHHTFSFANYHNPERMNFGVLRVLNDDQVHPGKGFGTHPHDNMEIISIPLEGDLEHKDSMGNVAVIKEGDVQVMSAGTGVYHSEYNRNSDKDVKFLQIWVFPNKKSVAPRYDQISIRAIEKENKFYQILSPNPDDQGVWIHQDAWFHLGKFTKGSGDTYTIQKPGNGVYAFILDGEVVINNEVLAKRDGMGVWDTDRIQVTATKDARVLLMEVPMRLS